MMKTNIRVWSAIGCIVILTSCGGNKKNEDKNMEVIYPETKRGDVIFEYFGTDVADPYNWLEDDNSEETAEWVKQENEVTFNYLAKIPFREQMKERLIEIWDYPRESAPSKKGDKYFYFKNNGLQNQSVLFYKTSLEGEEIELLDPNKLAEDGTVSLSTIEISEDGKYLAYAISRSGSDWQEIYVKNIETLEDTPDHLEWVKFSGIAWLNDGFYYSRYPAPAKGSELSGENLNSKVYYHKIGTSQDEDMLIYEDPANPEIGFYAEVTDSKNYLILTPSQSTSGNALYVKKLNDPNAKFIKIVEDFDKDYSVIDEIDNHLYVYTNYNAPKYSILKIDLNNYAAANWEIFIPEEEGVLKNISRVGHRFIANYMKDAYSVVKIFDESGKYLHNLDVNEIGTISGFSGSVDDEKTFYTVTSFTTPSTIYEYDIANNKSTLYKESEVKINSNDYVTNQIFYESKDGTKVPMFIVHKKGIEMNGKNPTLLYGYGGFNVTYTPSFSVSRMLLLEQGGIYVLANIRGGGEYGEAWHKAGTKLQKQNVFDDFIAAAEYLIENKYTSKEKLAIQGGSNGGLLVGAVTNQRPDLFAVALPAVGVMDMLRYHFFTIGRYWATDYGTSNESKEMFEYLYAYSPIHNIKPDVEYPAVLVTTGDHDDRVVPAHSFKYIAELQNVYKGKNPVLIRIETQAGHGAGKPTMKSIEEITDVYSFMFFNMNFTPKY
ncbi:prolyl oligopeptidase family serine peptidase [Bacteroidales bacterium OttesenSCG-928-I21]|nr:prolyl oligopeptidase family serine peptidase [Bacteroidales bacterium OttesenSCG-928-I21]